MRAPDFWFTSPKSPNWKARLLAPFGYIYARLTAARVAKLATFKASVPVICVGNINAGGTGKTPTAIAIAERLKAQNETVVFLTKGYGGSLIGPIKVNEQTHTAHQTGDEPLLLAAFATTIVSKSRKQGAQMAMDYGATVIVMDDGFQSPEISKDIQIVVVDAARGFGNERCIPAGPLREPVDKGLARADMIISIGAGSDQSDFAKSLSTDVPHLTGKLNPLPTGMPWQNMPVLAFAGIGHPRKFFDTLAQLGARVIHAEGLSDHQPLTNALMARLEADAKRHKAQLVTTEKDAVRLPKSFRTKVLTLPVRLQIVDWSAFDAAFAKAKGPT